MYMLLPGNISVSPCATCSSIYTHNYRPRDGHTLRLVRLISVFLMFIKLSCQLKNSNHILWPLFELCIHTNTTTAARVIAIRVDSVYNYIGRNGLMSMVLVVPSIYTWLVLFPLELNVLLYFLNSDIRFW